MTHLELTMTTQDPLLFYSCDTMLVRHFLASSVRPLYDSIRYKCRHSLLPRLDRGQVM